MNNQREKINGKDRNRLSADDSETTPVTPRKKVYVIGIIICSILLILSIILIPLTSGKDELASKLIYGLFSLWMAWGIYRGIRHLFYRSTPSLNPTYQGVEYNPVRIPLWKVVLDFFNPLKMKFRTMGSIFIVGSLGIYTWLVGAKLKIYFWVFLVLLIVLKGYLLFQTLRLAKGKNELGRVLNDSLGDFADSYDVTEELINADDSTSDDIIAPIRERVDIFGTYDDYIQNNSNFTIEQRHILALNYYISEVYGDSHYEFFTSFQGIAYLDAIEALKAIGANEYAKILLRAAEKFDGINHPVFDMEDRSDIIDASEIDFQEEDNALYDLDENGEKIEALMMAYIRKHPSKFIFKQP